MEGGEPDVVVFELELAGMVDPADGIDDEVARTQSEGGGITGNREARRGRSAGKCDAG